MFPEKEFKVNEYIRLKLEDEKTNIYVKGELFRQCKFLLLTIPVDLIEDYDELQSIDEVAENLNNSMEEIDGKILGIPPETEFWGHCSNLQVWHENNYNTKLISSNLAFPLLKRLTEVGDPLAKQVFKQEIAQRLDSGYLPVMVYLMINNYLKYISAEDVKSLKFFDNLKDFNSFAKYVEEFTPCNPSGWLAKAHILAIIKSSEELVAYYEKALTLFPQNLHLIKKYLELLNKLNLHLKAKKWAEELVKLQPEDYNNLNILSQIIIGIN